jgi:hypothetical protein
MHMENPNIVMMLLLLVHDNVLKINYLAFLSSCFFGLKFGTLFEVLLLFVLTKGIFFVTFQSQILVWGQF